MFARALNRTRLKIFQYRQVHFVQLDHSADITVESQRAVIRRVRADRVLDGEFVDAAEFKLQVIGNRLSKKTSSGCFSAISCTLSAVPSGLESST